MLLLQKKTLDETVVGARALSQKPLPELATVSGKPLSEPAFLSRSPSSEPTGPSMKRCRNLSPITLSRKPLSEQGPL